MKTTKHWYLSVMGTMGSGKTTVARLLSKAFNYRILEENFGENAFLPRFYNDMKRWAFHSQTFFLMEKITQMMETQKLLMASSIIQDTPIEQDAFSYAKAQHVLGNIDDAEWRLYLKIYHSFEPLFPKPDLVVFLETSIAEIEKRISLRARNYEKEIPQSYLELLDMLNRKWISEQKDVPVLTIATDGVNVVRSKKAQREVVRLVRSWLEKERHD